MDWSPLVQAAVTFAAAALTVGSGAVVALANRHITNAAEAKIVDDAVTAGAGVAYSALQGLTAGGTVNVAAAKTAAVAAGADAVKTIAGDLTPSSVVTMVEGGLGKLLATDPTVSAVPSQAKAS